jgi:hypothetical protein
MERVVVRPSVTECLAAKGQLDEDTHLLGTQLADTTLIDGYFVHHRRLGRCVKIRNRTPSAPT